jgi:UDP-GlcNAc:undecaprenyl-phosphate GlcNAc-1-phosphate transferase
MDFMDLAGVHAMALVGLLDDCCDLRPRHKALAGLSVAALLAVHVASSLGPGSGWVSFLEVLIPTHPVVVVPILMLWFWAVPQAYNLMDGINGLSLGFGALVLAVLSWNVGVQPMLLWGGMATVFLLNFPKAHHFIGDCGALMLGTLFSLLAVETFALRDPNLLLWVFAYPALDVSLVVAIRRWKGQPLGVADRSHFHHWMMERMGNRVWLATPCLLGLAVLPMTRATALPGHQAISLLGLVALAILIIKAFVDRVKEDSMPAPQAQARRPVPMMRARSEVALHSAEASGSHTAL